MSPSVSEKVTLAAHSIGVGNGNLARRHPRRRCAESSDDRSDAYRYHNLQVAIRSWNPSDPVQTYRQHSKGTCSHGGAVGLGVGGKNGFHANVRCLPGRDRIAAKVKIEPTKPSTSVASNQSEHEVVVSGVRNGADKETLEGPFKVWVRQLASSGTAAELQNQFRDQLQELEKRQTDGDSSITDEVIERIKGFIACDVGQYLFELSVTMDDIGLILCSSDVGIPVKSLLVTCDNRRMELGASLGHFTHRHDGIRRFNELLDCDGGKRRFRGCEGSV